MITITGVEVSPDVSSAKVYFSAVGGDQSREEAKKGLQSAAGWLRHELGQVLRLRRTPELIFRYDESLERGERISNILNELGLGDDDTDTTTG